LRFVDFGIVYCPASETEIGNGATYCNLSPDGKV
jgi:hypothetical protein